MFSSIIFEFPREQISVLTTLANQWGGGTFLSGEYCTLVITVIQSVIIVRCKMVANLLRFRPIEFYTYSHFCAFTKAIAMARHRNRHGPPWSLDGSPWRSLTPRSLPVHGLSMSIARALPRRGGIWMCVELIYVPNALTSAPRLYKKGGNRYREPSESSAVYR